MFFRHRFFAWWLGGPRRLILRRFNTDTYEAVLEVAGLRASQNLKFEFALEASTAASHTSHSPRRTVTTTVGEDRRFYLVKPSTAGDFRLQVTLPPDSLKPSSGQFTRVTRVHLHVFHPWFPSLDLGASEYGVICLQDQIIGLTPDAEGVELQTSPLEQVEQLPTRHSHTRVPGFLLGIVYLLLTAVPVVLPYLTVEWKFQRDLAILELMIIDTQLDLLSGRLDRAATFETVWNPGSVAWYGGYENVSYEMKKNELAVWIKVRSGTAAPDDLSRLYQGAPADLIKAEYFVQTGRASEAAELYAPYFQYEGEYWRLFPSLMYSIRLLQKTKGIEAASLLAHQCLARVPDWKRQNLQSQSPANIEQETFLRFWQENPPTAESR